MKTISKPDNFDSLSKEQQEIYEWLNSLQFRKKSFGGIDEADVWSKIGELNALYEKLLIAERAKYGVAKTTTVDDGENGRRTVQLTVVLAQLAFHRTFRYDGSSDP